MQNPDLAPVIVLAAGRGARMRPLSDHLPKPLLAVHGKPLLAWHLDALARVGVRRAVVNTAWLEDVLIAQMGTQCATVQLQYSREQRDFGQALETAGGITRALPYLQTCFWVTAGDVYAPDFVFDPQLYQDFAREPDGPQQSLAHVFLVPNPTHHPEGDFPLIARPGDEAGSSQTRYTFSTIALYRKALFSMPFCSIACGNPKGIVAPMAPLLRAAFAAGRVRSSLYTGAWVDVGTPERLAQLNADPVHQPQGAL